MRENTRYLPRVLLTGAVVAGGVLFYQSHAREAKQELVEKNFPSIREPLERIAEIELPKPEIPEIPEFEELEPPIPKSPINAASDLTVVMADLPADADGVVPGTTVTVTITVDYRGTDAELISMGAFMPVPERPIPRIPDSRTRTRFPESPTRGGSYTRSVISYESPECVYFIESCVCDGRLIKLTTNPPQYICYGIESCEDIDRYEPVGCDKNLRLDLRLEEALAKSGSLLRQNRRGVRVKLLMCWIQMDLLEGHEVDEEVVSYSPILSSNCPQNKAQDGKKSCEDSKEAWKGLEIVFNIWRSAKVQTVGRCLRSPSPDSFSREYKNIVAALSKSLRARHTPHSRGCRAALSRPNDRLVLKSGQRLSTLATSETANESSKLNSGNT